MNYKQVSLVFITDRGTKWYLTRDFNSKQHIDNFINSIVRNKNYTFDEIYYSVDELGILN
jgi:hypothetical protein